MDREKVIKGLEICTAKPCYCTDCPYKKECCLDSQNLMEDALVLLKKQEHVANHWDGYPYLKTIIQEDYMNDYTKPPLGASPAYISAENRIKELAEAISRASAEGRNYTGHITLWAKEIIWQCEIMQKSDKEYIGQ